jgi:ankyrin repeat protein
MDALAAQLKQPALLALGPLLHAAPLYEGALGAAAGAWRAAPRTGVLGELGFALLRADGAVVFAADAAALRVHDVLGDARALAAGALNGVLLSRAPPPGAGALLGGGSGSGGASPASPASPALPRGALATVLAVAPDADAKTAWLAAFYTCVTRAAPAEAQLEADWPHALLTGTLHAAAAAGDADALRALLRFTDAALMRAPLPPGVDAPPPADVHAADADGATPLHVAARAGAAEAVGALLEAGADAGAADADNETALHAAIGRGHCAAALALVVNAAPLGARSLLGATPLAALLAAAPLADARDAADEPARELRGLAEALLSYGAPASDADGEGFAPAHRVAALHGAEALVKALAKAGADFNARALLATPDGAEVRGRGGRGRGRGPQAAPSAPSLTASRAHLPLSPAGLADAAAHCLRRGFCRRRARRGGL